MTRLGRRGNLFNLLDKLNNTQNFARAIIFCLRFMQLCWRSRAGPTTASGRVVGRQAYTKICAAAMGIAAPIELQRSSGFIITQLAYTKICAAAMGIAAPIELQRSSGFIITQLAVDVR